ncbi:MAG: decaprenyl-phosphate phosphoribosyltransferase [Actinomycetota bacterium]
MASGILKEARPKQWVKNVLVFAAPGAAGVLNQGHYLGRAIIAFVVFCMVSSGTYYWNDINDAVSDRSHPTKRNRPIASGAVPLHLARVIGTVLLVGGIGLGFVVHWHLAAAAAAYVLITTLYSTWWKHIAVVDLVAIASGFVVRAIGGAAATDVRMSMWFLLCTSFGSLFIVTGKRFAELRELGVHAGSTRATLGEYSPAFLQTVLAVTLGSTMVAYCIWAFETTQAAPSQHPFYELSIVPMVIALLRYLLVLEQGRGAAPEEIFVADRTLQLMGIIWVVVFGLGVYVH